MSHCYDHHHTHTLDSSSTACVMTSIKFPHSSPHRSPITKRDCQVSKKKKKKDGAELLPWWAPRGGWALQVHTAAQGPTPESHEEVGSYSRSEPGRWCLKNTEPESVIRSNPSEIYDIKKNVSSSHQDSSAAGPHSPGWSVESPAQSFPPSHVWTPRLCKAGNISQQPPCLHGLLAGWLKPECETEKHIYKIKQELCTKSFHR